MESQEPFVPDRNVESALPHASTDGAESGSPVAPKGPITLADDGVSTRSEAREELRPRSRFRPANFRMQVRTFDSFRYGRYLRLWFAMLCFSSGYWLQQIVVGWLTYDVTGSPLWTSLALGLDALPILLVGPIGGVLVDRFSRKRLIAFIYGYQATISAIFAAVVLTGNLELWHIFVYVPLMGVAIVINDPARMSLIANIVPKENLVNAFALSSLSFSLPRLTVPALGGLAIVLAGPGVALALEAGLQLGALLIVMGLNAPKTTRQSLRMRTVFSDIVDGVRYILREPVLIGLFALIPLPALLVMPSVQGLMPVYAAEVFHVDASGLGVLMSAAGAGSILGTLFLASKGDIRSRNVVVLASMFTMAIATGIFSINVFFPTAYVNLIFINASMMIYFSISSAIIHGRVSDDFRGRVAGLYILPWGLLPLGGLGTGFLAERLGAPHATQIASGIMIVLLCLLVWRIRTLRQLAPVATD